MVAWRVSARMLLAVSPFSPFPTAATSACGTALPLVAAPPSVAISRRRPRAVAVAGFLLVLVLPMFGWRVAVTSWRAAVGMAAPAPLVLAPPPTHAQIAPV